MTKNRYTQLNGPIDHTLTAKEIKQGWHFCYEFDGLCRNSNEEEFKCDCNEYQRIGDDNSKRDSPQKEEP